MKSRSFNRFIAAVLIAVIMLQLTSCAEMEGNGSYLIYFANSSYDDIEHMNYMLNNEASMDSLSKAGELLHQMFDVDYTDANHYPAKPENVALLNCAIDKTGVLTADFSKEYLEMTNVQEIILRASVVLTVIQIDGISGIKITVEGTPVKYSNGQEIGVMTADDFVNIILGESGMLKQETDVIVYFTNEEGNRLIPVSYHLVINNNNTSIEEYILNQIIAGPDSAGNAGQIGTASGSSTGSITPNYNANVYPTISKSVELINVVTTDRVCYVNFTDKFLTQEQQPVSDEILIFSIVNSLCRLTYVNSVQFLINGETVSTLHTVTDISKPFTRNRQLEGEPEYTEEF